MIADVPVCAQKMMRKQDHRKEQDKYADMESFRGQRMTWQWGAALSSDSRTGSGVSPVRWTETGTPTVFDDGSVTWQVAASLADVNVVDSCA